VSKAIREIALRAGYPDRRLIVRYSHRLRQFAARRSGSRETDSLCARLGKKVCDYLIRAAAQLMARHREGGW